MFVSVARVVAARDALTFDVGARVLMLDVGSGEFNLLGQPRANRIDDSGIKDGTCSLGSADCCFNQCHPRDGDDTSKTYYKQYGCNVKNISSGLNLLRKIRWICAYGVTLCVGIRNTV